MSDLTVPVPDAPPPPPATRVLDTPAIREAAAMQAAEPAATPAVSLNAFAVDAAWYTVMAVCAGIWRLNQLGGHPLDAREAVNALGVWRFLHPGSVLSTPPESGFAFTGGVLMQGLFGASDWSARLFAVLCGIALVLTPVLYRRWIGRSGARAAAFLLVFSPIAVASARQATWETPAALCAALALALLMDWLTNPEPHRGRLPLAMVALGLVVASGPGVLTTFVLVGLSGGVWWLLSPTFRQRLAQAWAERTRKMPSTDAGLAAVAFVGAVVLGSTAFFLYPGGLGVIGNSLTTWLQSFGAPAVDLIGGPFSGWVVLGLYEMLVVAFGLAGLLAWWIAAVRTAPSVKATPREVAVVSPRRKRKQAVVADDEDEDEDDEEDEDDARVTRRRQATGAQTDVFAHMATPISVWVLAGFLLALFRQSATPSEALWLILPLAGVGGALLGTAWDTRAEMREMRLMGGLAAVFGAMAYFMLVLVAAYKQAPDQVLYGWMVPLALAIMTLSAAAAIIWETAQWRAVLFAALIPLGAHAWSDAYGLSVLRPSAAREPWVVQPTSPRIYTVLDVVERLSREKTGMPHDAALVVQAPQNSALAWYLRDYAEATYVEALDPTTSAPIVIAPAEVISPTVAAGYGYIGADFALGEGWSPSEMTFPQVMYWITVRSGGSTHPLDSYIVWREVTQASRQP